MANHEEVESLVGTMTELMAALQEQVTQKERRCQQLERQLACQTQRIHQLEAEAKRLINQGITPPLSRQSVILFPQTPAT